jgi:hypothetical protein
MTSDQQLKTLVLALIVAVAPASAFAQSSGGGPPANVRMRIGPLFINPTIALSNAGQDTNVFNEATNAKTDFTVTVTPGTDLWLRFGPTWFQGNISEDLVWYQKFASERSANNSYSLKWLVPLNRVTLTPTWSYANTRARPGFEIDARAERTEMAYGGTIELRFLSKTSVIAEATRQTTDFAAAAEFLGVNLHDELNRTGTTESVSLAHRITPLTTLAATGSMSQDRFKFDPRRNSDSRTVSGGIKFDPAALIKGSARFGYNDFRPASADVPGYKGSTVAVDLSYVFLGVTKLAFTAGRDVQYSYDVNQPYYVQTGTGGSISQQLFGPLDVVVRGALRRLEYRDRVGAVIPVAERVDHQQTYGAGIGYHLGRDTRIGVNVDQSNRESAVSFRRYKGWQYGVAVTYASGS